MFRFALIVLKKLFFSAFIWLANVKHQRVAVLNDNFGPLSFLVAHATCALRAELDSSPHIGLGEGWSFAGR